MSNTTPATAGSGTLLRSMSSPPTFGRSLDTATGIGFPPGPPTTAPVEVLGAPGAASDMGESSNDTVQNSTRSRQAAAAYPWSTHVADQSRQSPTRWSVLVDTYREKLSSTIVIWISRG